MLGGKRTGGIRKLALLVLVLLLAMLGASVATAGAPAGAPAQGQTQAEVPDWAKDLVGRNVGTLRYVRTADRFDISPPLTSIKPVAPLPDVPGVVREIPELAIGPEAKDNGFTGDGAAQTIVGALSIPTPIVSFDGQPNRNNVSPPDPVGDVSANYYVAMSNLSFQIFDKSGTSLFGPVNTNTLWAGFGGPCETQNAGDPIVLHDQMADRWILTQFTSSAVGGNYYNCVAVSQTANPTATYYRYAFSTGNNFPDYPKYGVWPDAYYISTREFAGGSSFAGIGAYATERAQMLVGNPAARVVSFLVPPSPAYLGGDGLLPADLDGDTLPPAGSDNWWMGSMDNGGPYGAPQDALNFFRFHVDWTTPANSTFTYVGPIPIAAYDTVFPCTGGARGCIPQPGTTNRIDILSYRQRPIHRLAYRNFGTWESLVTNQSVEGAPGIAGTRWWEVRNPGASPTLYQEGTYVPGSTDGIHRWMGSIAMDGSGNMGMGHSASNGTNVYPSVWYTGRLLSDPLGTMPQGEASIIDGTGSQTGSQRWGDYTSMNVDPSDDCTFWYVNEWVPTTSSIGWRLRIGAFKFPSCTGNIGTATPTFTGTPPTFTRTPTPTNTVPATNTNTPVPTPCGAYTYATATGTIVPGTTNAGSACDDCSVAIALPFPFTLYGVPYTTVNAISNGNLQFVTSDTAFTNACLYAATHGPSLHPHWDDLRTDGTTCTGGCGIFTSTSGSAPNRIFNIEYRTTYFSGGGTANFEVRLYENQATRAFEFIYGTLSQGGASATTGVQSASAASFTQYQCNTGIANGLQLNWTTLPCITNTPTRTPTPTIPPITNTPTNTPTVTPCAMNFSDVNPSDYFYVPVRYLYCAGVISGYADGTFRPYNNTTRGQMTKIIILAFDYAIYIPPTPTFIDVPTTDPFYQYIETAAYNQIVSGYSDGTFRPYNNVTRGQLSKIDVVAAGWPIINPPTPTFSDVPTTDPFYTYIETAFCHGVISGYSDGTFRPGNNATRGQISKIVYESVINTVTCLLE